PVTAAVFSSTWAASRLAPAPHAASPSARNVRSGLVGESCDCGMASRLLKASQPNGEADPARAVAALHRGGSGLGSGKGLYLPKFCVPRGSTQHSGTANRDCRENPMTI